MIEGGDKQSRAFSLVSTDVESISIVAPLNTIFTCLFRNPVLKKRS